MRDWDTHAKWIGFPPIPGLAVAEDMGPNTFIQTPHVGTRKLNSRTERRVVHRPAKE
jgi:hypothetical protein